jgi:Tol biopolymer transport system component
MNSAGPRAFGSARSAATLGFTPLERSVTPSDSSTLREISSISEPRPIHFPGRRTRIGLWIAVGAVALVAAAFVLSGLLTRRGAEPRPVRRYSIILPREAPLAPSSFVDPQPPLALSPDGHWLVYVARTKTSTRLMRRRLDGLEVEPINFAEGGVSSPFFSPDAKWVGFRRWGGGPEKILLTGQYPPRSIRDPAESGGLAGAAWQSDGTIVFGGGNPPGIYRVPEGGGAAEPVVIADREAAERGMAFPEPLPGGTGMLFTKYGHFGQLGRLLVMMDFSSAEISGTALRDVPYGRYAPSGHVVFPRGDQLMAGAFDIDALAFTGEIVDVSEPGMGVDGREPHEWVFSQDGTMVYAPMTAEQQAHRSLVLADRSGTEEQLEYPQMTDFDWGRLSPDGRHVVTGLMNQQFWRSIWINSIDTGITVGITSVPGSDGHPVWTPDGERIVFSSSRDGFGDLYWKPANMGGEAERLTHLEPGHFPVAYSWSADGTALFFWHWGPPADGGVLWVLHFDDDPPWSERVFENEDAVWHPAISPDGRWLAYVAAGMIQVSPYPKMNRFWLVSSRGGTFPMWHPDGSWIFFLDPEGRLMEAEVRTDPAFSVGRAQLVLEGPFESFDVAADGDRFLVVKIDRGKPITELVVVENWFEELKRKAPPR